VAGRTFVDQMHAATLQGGAEMSVYAAYCHLQVERRTIPGETVAQAASELQAILDELKAEDKTFRGEVRPFFHREPFEVDKNAAIVQALMAASAKRMGMPPIHAGQTFWTDAAILADAGIETVLIGPVGAGLHSAEEWVDIQSVVDLAGVLAETAVRYCR
ncbi:MAG: M20/M25/M40 family metallo-hydrolase, partial [Anaerolineae bacterium]